MALKPDRFEQVVDISFFLNEVATRGSICTHQTTGSGAAMDQSAALVIVATGVGAENVPAGLLLNDMVNLDLTRQHINQHQDEMQQGGKVALLRQGWVVTNSLTSGETPIAGMAAHFDSSGDVTTVTTSQPIGRFLSKPDEDGYAKVEINITGATS